MVREPFPEDMLAPPTNLRIPFETVVLPLYELFPDNVTNPVPE